MPRPSCRPVSTPNQRSNVLEPSIKTITPATNPTIYKKKLSANSPIKLKNTVNIRNEIISNAKVKKEIIKSEKTFFVF